MKDEIKKMFTTYDEAFKLRALGFNDVCVLYFSIYKELSPSAKGTSNDDEVYKNNQLCVTAPTKDQAIEFMINLIDGEFVNFNAIETYNDGGGRIRFEEDIFFDSKQNCLDELFDFYEKLLEERKSLYEEDED
jgi:hypothetical protein